MYTKDCKLEKTCANKRDIWLLWDISKCSEQFSTNIYLIKVTKRNTTKRHEICSKLTIKTTEPSESLRSGAFIVNLEHISYLFLVFLLLNLNR